MGRWRSAWRGFPLWRRRTAVVLASVAVLGAVAGLAENEAAWWIPLFIFGIMAFATAKPD